MENTHHSTVTAWSRRLFILLPPYCRNRRWPEAFHRSSDMNRSSETILREGFRANDKTKRSGGLKFAWWAQTNLFHWAVKLGFTGELSSEMPALGLETLLQPCTTQRLVGIIFSKASVEYGGISMTKFNNQGLISNYPNCTCINAKLNSNETILCSKSWMHPTEAEG